MSLQRQIDLAGQDETFGKLTVSDILSLRIYDSVSYD